MVISFNVLFRVYNPSRKKFCYDFYSLSSVFFCFFVFLIFVHLQPICLHLKTLFKKIPIHEDKTQQKIIYLHFY